MKHEDPFLLIISILRYNNVGDDGFLALLSAVENNTSLDELVMMNNTVSDRGLEPLGKIMQHNTTLRKINFRGNRIGDEGKLENQQILTPDPATRAMIN